jgi:transcriptional regulator with PAS, ATPase and Fis domain
MAKILLTWLGVTDLKSSRQETGGHLGPIAGAVTERGYKNVYILSCHSKTDDSNYIKWLKSVTSVNAVIKNVTIKHPMDFDSIYETAKQFTFEIEKTHKAVEPVFALSPGTPAMAAAWIILSKTLFLQAELIESSVQDAKGDYQVRTASVPFDISAERVIDMLRGPDEKLNMLFQNLPPKKDRFPEIVYKCEKMERAITLARHAAIRNVPVLLLGESGTGKEMIAKVIYTQSLRADKKFVALNCGAVSPNLIESELFGHTAQAFTGAKTRKDGRFTQADKGTLFLDEIGDLDFDLQVKLLRAIQEKEICPVGDSKSYKIDVRIIAATHKNLINEVAKGNFRSDLFYRLGVAIIHIPPLRERGKDIDYLIEYYMAIINEEFATQPNYKGPKKISPAARIVLRNYQWPGNVRELENTLKRAAMWAPDSTIDKQDMLDSIIPVISKDDCDLLNRPLGPNFNIDSIIDEVARHYLQRALKEAGGNKSRAAALIGLENHQNFTNWMKKHNVDSDK